MSSSTHLAAIAPSRGSSLVVQSRPTPTPGPTEVLIEVKSIAINPIDYMQRDLGFPSVGFPAVLGSDVAGIVLSVGSAVPSDTPTPGSRVAAFAPCFFEKGKPDYGAFQERVLVPAANVTPLPDRISFNEGSLLPMAVQTAWDGWWTLGINNKAYTPADRKGMLVWGAASSVGTMALQTAKSLGYTVLATASAKHHEYLTGLGATVVVDYKSPDAVAQLVKAANELELSLDTAFLAAGDRTACLQVLKGLNGVNPVKLASAPFSFGLLWWKVFPKWRGAEVKFVVAPTKPMELEELYHFIFNVWLKEKLESGELVPSPQLRVIPGGLEAIQQGLDELKKGLSGEKLVFEVSSLSS